MKRAATFEEALWMLAYGQWCSMHDDDSIPHFVDSMHDQSVVDSKDLQIVRDIRLTLEARSIGIPVANQSVFIELARALADGNATMEVADVCTAAIDRISAENVPGKDDAIRIIREEASRWAQEKRI